jgi:transcriptional regulator with XRE-family HTH domain
MSIGQALRDARRQAGFTQTELARRLGTTQSAVARAETDAVEPSIGYVRRVAAATSQPITLRILPPLPIDAAEARRRWSATDGRNFDPWTRNPEGAEARQLKRAQAKSS